MPPYVVPLEPAAIRPFIDKVQIWIPNPLSKGTLARLRKNCGPGDIYWKTKPARFDARYRQRIELRQPNDRALRWLAQRHDALINRVELAVDYVFYYRAARDDAWEFLNRHLVRRWRSRKQTIRHKPQHTTGGTRYDAGRGAPNLLVLYPTDFCRITGELNCLHLEWRLNQLKAVRRVGIESGQDLLEFDHRQFWKERLLLFTVNKERLGRLINNHIEGRRSRSSRMVGVGEHYKINRDERTGDVYIRSHSTVQELIDELRSSCRICRALVSIPNEALLPA
jgi:hypothetical protein